MTNITKHTLGPWAQNGSRIFYRLSSGLTEKIATVHGGKFGNPHPNAHLIAAAPELLTETQKADDIVGVLLTHLTEEQKKRVAIDLLNRGFHGTEDRARHAAIAKATGKEAV